MMISRKSNFSGKKRRGSIDPEPMKIEEEIPIMKRRGSIEENLPSQTVLEVNGISQL